MKNPVMCLRLTCLLAPAILIGCMAPTPPAGPGETRNDEPRRAQTVTIGVTGTVSSMSVSSASTPAGGWNTTEEIHSNGLITSDLQTRKAIGHLAERAPSFDDGSVSLLPDGRMRVVFNLRTGVTWQDGAPFTAQDLLFSTQILKDSGLPFRRGDPIGQLESAEAPDDFTFVMNYREPYYEGATLGLQRFWPQPRHLLASAYEKYRSTGNADDVMGLPYWSSEYVHLGAFRLTEFDPGSGLVLQAYDRYFLGKPKVDVIRIQAFGDQSTMFSNLLAGTIDLIPDLALAAERGFQLQKAWKETGGGTAYARQGAPFSLIPQHRPRVQTEPANLDPRVRAALYYALDRAELSDGVNGGNPQFAISTILPEEDPLSAVIAGALNQFRYDPGRALALLREAGWVRDQDGALRHTSDGRRYQVEIVAVAGREQEIAAMADYWRRLGIEAGERIHPGAQVRDNEYRATYPSWEATGPGIIGSLVGPAASAATRWVGSRPGYEDQRADQLVSIFRSSISDRDQAQAIRAISDFVVAELPLLPLYWLADYIGVRTGVRALDDMAGGAGVQRAYGGYFRAAYLWEVVG